MRCKSTKKLKKLQTFGLYFAKFVYSRLILYLCSVKRIAYIAPIDYIRGSLSGRQELKYNGGHAYDIATGQKVAADTYMPRLIAKLYHAHTAGEFRAFQVRTRSTVNMTASNKISLAVMGGAGAIYAALLNNSSAPVYSDCISAWHAANIKGLEFRGYMMPKIMQGLRNKVASIVIAEGVEIVNPWISSSTPNVPVSSAILDRFSSQLSN